MNPIEPTAFEIVRGVALALVSVASAVVLFRTGRRFSRWIRSEEED